MDAPLASAVVAFDALVINVDRTPKNPNMLCWHRQLWLIDHGAALYVHHGWDDWRRRAEAPFPLLRQHVLFPLADALPEAARELARRLTPEIVDQAVAHIPEAWLASDPAFATAEEVREAYRTWFSLRLAALPRLLEEATRG